MMVMGIKTVHQQGSKFSEVTDRIDDSSQTNYTVYLKLNVSISQTIN